MKFTAKFAGLLLLAWLGALPPAWGAVSDPGRKILHGHMPAVLARLTPIGRLAATNELHLAIGLPLRNPAELDDFLRQLQDPASTNYHKFLTPEEFAARFGPTTNDYQAVIQFAETNGFTVTGTPRSRMLLDVAASATNVERAFRVTLRTYHHPTEARDFFAPDTEPSAPADLPVIDVQGLSDFVRLFPKSHVRRPAMVTPQNGSAPDGSSYFGDDFRNAYVPGTTLTGAGQMVGLVQFDGFYPNDIAAYATAAGGGRTNIIIQRVLLDGFSGTPTTGANSGNGEVSLDIEMAMAMAPGLAKIVVFEAPNSTAYFNDILNAMAASNQVKNLSCSWGGGGANATSEGIFKRFAAQGQSFFNASGDSDAFTGAVPFPSESTNITQVGGTTLTMNGTGASYAAETVWNWGIEYGSANDGSGSSGGISTTYQIPSWQQGFNLAANGGSTTMRNIPDVALTADHVYVYYSNGSTDWFGGTSCAAPLWAGFMALVNQQLVTASGIATNSVGFINPAVYEIGRESIYNSAFHDTTTGNNTWSSSPNLFYATPGYDLCTGLGTPAGTNLINALVDPDSLLVVSNGGFNAFVSLFKTFIPVLQTFYLTNAGASSLTWSLVNTSSWLNVSGGGVLAAGTGGSVTVSLNPAVTNYSAGSYTANLGFSNVTSGVTHYRLFTLIVSDNLVQNNGFETGDFTDWTLNGSAYPYTYVTNSITYNIGTHRRPINITINAHSGTYFAAMHQSGAPAYLSQTVSTVAGQQYLLSLWLDSPDGVTPNEFSVSWNGGTLFNYTNLAQLGWTNLQFVVTAVGSSSVLQIGGQDNSAYLGLDDVSVKPIFPPSISTPTTNLTILSGSNAVFTVTAGGAAPLAYQWRKGGTNLANGAGISGATSNVLTLAGVTTGSSGNYSLAVTNIYGAATSSVAALTVVLPPAITSSSLTNRTLQCGSNNMTFTVTASGTPPLNFQWSLDGAPVANATNTSFAVTNLHLPSPHNVAVVITNLYASTTSNAVLTVQDTLAPAITLNGGSPLYVELGGAFTDPGVMANDICAGAVSAVVSGAVNTNWLRHQHADLHRQRRQRQHQHPHAHRHRARHHAAHDFVELHQPWCWRRIPIALP